MLLTLRRFYLIVRCCGQFLADRYPIEGIPPHQYEYALVICNNPGITQEELAGRIHVNKSNVTRVLAQMQSMAYVERRPQAADRRRMEVYPTEKLLACRETIRSGLQECEQYLTCDFTQEEADTMRELISRMAGRAAAYHTRKGGDAT